MYLTKIIENTLVNTILLFNDLLKNYIMSNLNNIIDMIFI